MNRRDVLGVTLGSLMTGSLAHAHHGWSSFDQNRPIFLSGRAVDVRWRNPHAEMALMLDQPLQLPADLVQRRPPAQSSGVDGSALLKKTVLPTRRDPRLEIEIAPISRMNQWQIPRIEDGQRIEVLGFTFTGESGAPLLRAEYLFLGERIYGLRSSPA